VSKTMNLRALKAVGSCLKIGAGDGNRIYRGLPIVSENHDVRHIAHPSRLNERLNGQPRLTAGRQHQASQPAMRRIGVVTRVPHL
jgi:hypothetical protein